MKNPFIEILAFLGTKAFLSKSWIGLSQNKVALHRSQHSRVRHWRTTAAYTTTAPSAIARPVSSSILAHVTAVWGSAVLMNAERLAEVVKEWDYEESYIEEDVVYVWRNCRGCGWRVADGRLSPKR